MVLNDFGSVVLAFNQNAILFVRNNGNVLFNLSTTQEFLVAFRYDTVIVLLLNDV